MDGDYRNMESVLHKVNNFIKLKKADRFEYTNHFNRIRDHLLRNMCEIDDNFRMVYNGPCLAGSYADNLKISKPDEFDLVFHIKIPDRRLIDVERDPERPGNVYINMTRLLQKISKEGHQKSLHALFYRLVNRKGYLVQTRFQSWIESIVTKALEMPIYSCDRNDGYKPYTLRYIKAGPAHTLIVKTDNTIFSIDFVPGILFDNFNWPGKRKYPSNATWTDWIAVPKPISTWFENISFRASFVDTEREIIHGHYDLKNCLRLFKKIRDNLNIQNLKSYYIKTIFLLENERVRAIYWDSSSLTDIFLHMFKKLLDVLQSGNLPYFWDSDCNMFSNLSHSQLKTMYDQWMAAYRYCLKYKDTEPHRLFTLFLTEEEIQSMLPQLVNDSWSCTIL